MLISCTVGHMPIPWLGVGVEGRPSGMLKLLPQETQGALTKKGGRDPA